jgi:DNA-binding transcriptional ArsR family regulator
MKAAAAIADPVRREILEFLSAGAAPAGAIASRFTISRPAVSRHLRVLRDSGLVVDRLVGRQRVYTLDPAPLSAIVEWIQRLDSSAEVGRPAWDPSSEWAQRLDALETEVVRTRRQRGSTARTGPLDTDQPGAGQHGTDQRGAGQRGTDQRGTDQRGTDQLNEETA